MIAVPTLSRLQRQTAAPWHARTATCRGEGLRQSDHCFRQYRADLRRAGAARGRQGMKPTADQVDPKLWVYDLGENGDLSVDALVSDNVRDLVARFAIIPNAKGSFATKYVNRDLLGYDPQGKTRIRFS